jgi:ketosteroid isomerase-like protein
VLSFVVRRIVEQAYRQANAFDLDPLIGSFAPDAVFEFHGDSPLGGERHGPEAIRAWFEQVRRDFGRLELTAQDVVASGPPWNMRVVVRLTDRYHLISGDTLANHGFQYLRLRWGKVVEDRVLVDLTIVRRALELVERSACGPARG